MDGGCYIPTSVSLDEGLRELKELDPKLHETWESTYDKSLNRDHPVNTQILIELLENHIKGKGWTLDLPSEPGENKFWRVRIKSISIVQDNTCSCESQSKVEALLGSYLGLIKMDPKLVRE